MIKILLADDHRIVREGLKLIFSDSGDIRVVGECDTGTQVLSSVDALYLRDGVDLVLLDIAMPEHDGLEVLQVLRRKYPLLPVLILSTYPEKQYAVRCIRLGAAGYLNKSADPEDMLLAIRTVVTGKMYVSPATALALASAVSSMALGSNSVGTDSLSHREHQVFQLLITGLSVGEIAQKLKLASNTVSTYRSRILEKTGAKNDVELALWSDKQAGGAALR